jgi:mono/diheme cytochrome c family protein
MAAVLLCSAAAACQGAASSSKPAGAGADAARASTAPVKVDLDHIFPAGSGRDLVLENCQNCHTFVPIVVLQMDKDAWYRSSLDHRARVTTLTEEQFTTLYAYLQANFGPEHPVPQLPKELLKTWTGY